MNAQQERRHFVQGHANHVATTPSLSFGVSKNTIQSLCDFRVTQTQHTVVDCNMPLRAGQPLIQPLPAAASSRNVNMTVCSLPSSPPTEV